MKGGCCITGSGKFVYTIAFAEVAVIKLDERSSMNCHHTHPRELFLCYLASVDVIVSARVLYNLANRITVLHLI